MIDLQCRSGRVFMSGTVIGWIDLELRWHPYIARYVTKPLTAATLPELLGLIRRKVEEVHRVTQPS